MFRVAQVASYDQHPDVPSVRSVDDGVGEVLQWMNAAEFVCGCANVREPKQQFHDAFELVEEAVCQLRSTLLAIEACCLKASSSAPR